MKYGMSLNDMNFARSQSAAAGSGLASMLGSLGQMNFSNTGARNNMPTNGQGTTVTSILDNIFGRNKITASPNMYPEVNWPAQPSTAL
jgi:hypothetical protein